MIYGLGNFGVFFFYLQKKKDFNEMLKETGGKRAQKFKKVQERWY